MILGSCKEVVERRQACLTTGHASKKILLHLQSAAQPSLPIQGGTSSGSFQAEYEYIQREGVFLLKNLKTHKKYRNFS